MPSIARGQTSDCVNPVIDLFTRVGGVLTDIYSLSYQIFDTISGPSPVQVYPSSGRQAVAVGVACPTGDKIGTGHYVARWTVPDAEPVGTHEVRWFFKLLSASPEQSFVEEFDVLAVTSAAPHEYATVQQLRDEGITLARASDAQLLAKIRRNSALIDKWTGRWFYPKTRTLLLDGTGGVLLLLGHPIISISEVKLLGQGALYVGQGDEVMDPNDFRIFNRHLTEELTDPDDRNNPKIQWLSFDPWRNRMPGIYPLGVFPRGVQNIQITGVFGYTDPDGSSTGKTPDLINYLCMLLVVRDSPKLADIEERDEYLQRARQTGLRTRDQSITWQASPNRSGWTGDPEIDGLIASFRRPPTLGST